MSCKCLLFFLIISQVKVAHPSKDQNASINGCVRFNWIEDFFARQRQSQWKNTVKDILQYCLSNYSKVNETTGCNGPIVNVTFPLFSCPSNFTLLEREVFPLVAIKEESFSIGRQILHAFKQIWELIVICITGAMLSGIIIWFLDHRANAGHFPDSFWRGVQDGWWWAVVTMTTVGYGDKAPKSSLARVYASLWMIIGMLLMSTITAQISSSITADGLRPLNDVFGSKVLASMFLLGLLSLLSCFYILPNCQQTQKYSYKGLVGVPLGSKKSLEKENHGINMKEYRTERELLNGLIDGSVDAILLFDCGTVEMKRQPPHLTIVDASEFNLTIRVGFAVEEGNENLEECLQYWTNEECSTEQMNGDGDTDDECEDWQWSCFEEYSHGKYRHDMKQGSSNDRVKTHHFILMSSAGLFVIFLLTGSLRNACRKGRPTTDDVDIEKGVSHTKLRASITDAVPMKELSSQILHYDTEQNTIENITN